MNVLKYLEAYINMKKWWKKEILLQVPVPETTERRYGLNKGYVLNFSLSQVLWCLLSVIALCEKKWLEAIKNNMIAG